jgi:hypothetical protein
MAEVICFSTSSRADLIVFSLLKIREKKYNTFQRGMAQIRITRIIPQNFSKGEVTLKVT